MQLLFLNLAILFTVATLVSAAPALSDATTHTLHEKRATDPRSWIKRSKVAAGTLLPMRIGLKQRNLHLGYDLLMEISNHDSPKYGQHYTPEEIVELFAPPANAADEVISWLMSAGIDQENVKLSANKQWVMFDATTDDAESLFKTEYHVYEHVSTGSSNVACDEYHVPGHIQEHIDYITPGIRLIPGKAKRSTKKSKVKRVGSSGTGHAGPVIQRPNADTVVPATCNEALITADCLRALYNISVATLAAPGNELGIFESTDDMYNQADLNNFWANFAPNVPQGTGPILDSVDGGTAPTPIVADSGIESSIDFEIAIPLIYPQSTILFQADDDIYEEEDDLSGFYNTFLDAIDGSYCNYTAFGITGDSPGLDPVYPDPQPGGFKGQLECGIYKPTNVISISYAGEEFDFSPSYQERQCNEYMKLGLQGVSVVFCSGDNGVADNFNFCISEDPPIFSPGWPQNCPYVTVVGATFLTGGVEVAAQVQPPETGTDTTYASGGGFSNVYPIPDYQASAVATYFATSNPPYAFYETLNNTQVSSATQNGSYNRIGRAYPDVSAVGQDTALWWQGVPRLSFGTSVATPIFASVLNLINEERIAAGKSTIGFVNPTLYANPHVLNDITSGNNPGCKTNGFETAVGWDPVTGLGSPNYPAMLELFMSLP